MDMLGGGVGSGVKYISMSGGITVAGRERISLRSLSRSIIIDTFKCGINNEVYESLSI